METVREILAKSADEMSNWISEYFEGLITLAPGVGLLTIAEALGFEAFKENPVNAKQVKNAISIYDYLASSTTDNSHENFLYSAMNLRVRLILETAQVSSDPVLHLDQIENWFLLHLYEPLNVVKNKLDRLEKLSAAELRKLRQIKNCLKVIGLLANYTFRNEEIVRPWLAMKDKLP